jgi:hypothetical protein
LLEVKKQKEIRLAYLQEHVSNLMNNINALNQRYQQEISAVQMQLASTKGGVQEIELDLSNFE